MLEPAATAAGRRTDLSGNLTKRREPCIRRMQADHSSKGIIYPSVRNAGGTCLAVFGPIWSRIFRRVPSGVLSGAPQPTVTQQ
jgi:hypothetical protein